MGSKNDGVLVQEYLYDFAEDGGTTGEKVLSNKSAKDPLPVGALVKSVTLKVITAFTSGGAATLTWGSSTDVDGYSGTAIAVASLTANSRFSGNEDAAAPGALLYATIGTTPAAVKSKAPALVSDANSGAVSVSINAAAMTAGKALLVVEYYYPSL